MRIRSFPAVMFVVVCVMFTFNSCIKDKCRQTYTYTFYEPVYRTKNEVRANIKSNAPRELVNTGKLYLFGNHIFLNEMDKGIHVIDNSNPAQPRNIAFIDIPGSLEIAIKGNILYTDLYTDLVAIDVSTPSNVVVKKIIDNVFPHRLYTNGFVPDNSKVITDWKRKDTTVELGCNDGGWFTRADVFLAMANVGGAQGGSSSSSSPIGIGGSMARFTIMNDRLYTVNHSDIDVFNITTSTNPSHVSRVNTGNWDIETIYPFKNRLFIGSRTGMHIYNVSNPDNPVAAGQFQHVRTCDPVIAEDDYAYITLSSGSTCAGFTNQLDILKLNNLANPQLLKTYQMTNPKGLSKSGSYLFICDGSAGLKVYDASNVMDLQLKKTIGGMETFDVIAYNNIALVVAKDGLYQYNYADINNIQLLSKITVNK